MKKNEKFSVITYSLIEGKSKLNYVHWSDGLKMIIAKNGLVVELNSEEIEELKSNRSKKLIFNFVKKFSEILVEVGIKAIIEKYYS